MIFEHVSNKCSNQMIPAALIGLPRQVNSRWKKIAVRAWELGSWRQALQGEEFFELASYNIIISDSDFRITSPHILAYVSYETLKNIYREHRSEALPHGNLESVNKKYADLVLEGFDELWFLFGWLCPEWIVANEKMWPATYRNWGAMLLPKILARWREIVQLESRFISRHGGSAQWRVTIGGWSKTPLACCLAMGLEDESQFLEIAAMTPQEALVWLTEFLEKYNTSHP